MRMPKMELSPLHDNVGHLITFITDRYRLSFRLSRCQFFRRKDESEDALQDPQGSQHSNQREHVGKLETLVENRAAAEGGDWKSGEQVVWIPAGSDWISANVRAETRISGCPKGTVSEKNKTGVSKIGN